MAQRIIYWFRNDLRIEQNEAFNQAVQDSQEILPVFVFDTRLFEKTHLGFRRTGAIRAQMIINAVSALRENLRKIGGDLVIRIGDPEKIVAGLAEDFQADYVYAGKKIGPKETRIESSLSKNLKLSNIDFKLIWMDTLLDIATMPFPLAKLPNTFSSYCNAIQFLEPNSDQLPPITQLNLPSEHEAGPMPTLPMLGIDANEVPDNQIIPDFQEEDGKSQLEKFAEDIENGSFQGFTDPLIDSNLTTWLALGSISPRQVFKALADIPESNEGRKAAINSLHYRDYAHFNLLRFGPRFFKPSGVQHHFHRKWVNDNALFDQWKNGKTANADVNNIIEKLAHTGIIRLDERYLAARYLVEDLNVNWIWGAMYFESLLLDYDVAVSWGRWNGVAGVGFD